MTKKSIKKIPTGVLPVGIFYKLPGYCSTCQLFFFTSACVITSYPWRRNHAVITSASAVVVPAFSFTFSFANSFTAAFIPVFMSGLDTTVIVVTAAAAIIRTTATVISTAITTAAVVSTTVAAAT